MAQVQAFNSLRVMVEVGMMSSRVHIHDFESADTLTDALSESIAKNLQKAIDTHGRASLIVSGGSTPKALFQKLRTFDIGWESVRVSLCDERWVAPSHDDSNEKLVRTHLLQDKAAKAAFVSMYVKGKEAKDAELTCKENIQSNLLPFTVMILGMGGDAHTASLFPNNTKLERGFDLNSEAVCIAIEPSDAPHMRMSLTRAAILSSEHLYLHFEGESKRKVFQEAMRGDDMHAMPIRSILHQDTKDVEVYYA
jgi:6-phosphogluconolactonase